MPVLRNGDRTIRGRRPPYLRHLNVFALPSNESTDSIRISREPDHNAEC